MCEGWPAPIGDWLLKECFLWNQPYCSFFSLPVRPLLPPLADSIALRGSCFRPGRTFRIYLGHIKRASLLAERPLERYTPVVREISRWLKRAQKRPFKRPNLIYAHDLYLVIDHIG